ncbi:MAG: flavodoxin-dependent (E)-4-hydroxy-3-methylbut-2-enyl-diphosphate synthase [Candidatus Omnitrophica bacterium]|nr:flavodoxin-dependent (E)-4-hydroxy-3-methylbut-2-enyl-diphosphate synthase [Candidatus Omnitrophota bacterium]
MSKTAKIGKLKIGAKYPIRIKGMLKTPIAKTKQLIGEAKSLEAEGVEAIRLAVLNEEGARAATILRKHVSVPLVADIHFQYKTALMAIDSGFEGIRLNPSNIYKKNEVISVVKSAKRNKISIRVGVNSGGFKKNFSSRRMMAKQMVKSAVDYIKILEKQNFFDTMVSFKGADVLTTLEANRMFAKKSDYPLHLGVTATGPFVDAVVKSSIGIGTLLSEGIGNVIRVSLSAPSVLEVQVAKAICQALDLRRFGPEIISCPTCSRCEVDLIKIVDEFKRKIEKDKIDKYCKVALMGCVVNGPGEAYQADIGAAFGKKKAAIFKKDKIIGWSNEKDIIGDLLKEVRKK